MSKKENQNMINNVASTIKDGADTAFDATENAVKRAAHAAEEGIEATESAAMNAVDGMAEATKKTMKQMNQE
jgi:hypothetical protein